MTENNYNSLPLGYKYDRSITNSPMLKIITPNFFKMGRNNNRALDGPIRMPGNGGELLQQVNQLYDGIFKLWADSYVPKLIYQPTKWNKDDKELQVGDLVYFQKEPDKKLASKWIVGVVDQLDRSRDGKIRKVIIRYQNSGETQPRLTERAIRSLVKIYDIEEYVLQEDLAEVMKRLVRYEGLEDLGEPDHAEAGEQYPLGEHDQVVAGQAVHNDVWLKEPAPPVHSITQDWDDKAMSFWESSGWASVFSGLLKNELGEVVETNLPDTFINDLHGDVAEPDVEEPDAEEPESANPEDSWPLFKMMRSTNNIFK